jgi:uncharacterized membrane protein
MNAAHLHLIVNHVPVVLVPVAALLLTWAVYRKSTELIGAGLVLLAAGALAGGAAFLSGEPAEEIVEHLAGVTERTIHGHEEAAEAAILATGFTGLLALVTFVAGPLRGRTPTTLIGVTILAAVTSAGALAYTAWLGGDIRHTELSGTAPVELGPDLDDR